jgi:hypothetical protein
MIVLHILKDLNVICGKNRTKLKFSFVFKFYTLQDITSILIVVLINLYFYKHL